MTRKKENKFETNAERLTRLMEYSHSGPLMQGFIMDAIMSRAQAVVDAFEKNPDLFNENWIVNPHAWHACATEIVATWGKTWAEIEAAAKIVTDTNKRGE